MSTSRVRPMTATMLVTVAMALTSQRPALPQARLEDVVATSFEIS